MKDRVKKALKRAASGLMAVLLAVCLVGTPRAKAVVSDGALLGSIFGSLLVSMGYSWAADNMDVPTFGESIYKLTQEFDEAMKDTGIQLIRDLTLSGLTATGAGKLQFGYPWVRAARSFAEWFSDKFCLTENETATVVDGGSYFLTSDGTEIYFSEWDSTTSKITAYGTKLQFTNLGDKLYLPNGAYFLYEKPRTYECIDFYYGGSYQAGFGSNACYLILNTLSSAPTVGFADTSGSVLDKDAFSASLLGDIYNAPSLTAEKPQEIHYPDVAEDGSQVYEITVDGVTATDIEGIIQGAVDRILAGTAAIAGSIADAQAKPGEEVANPEIDPYKVGLSSVFPFCIPFDVYNMVTMFVAEPEAPNAEWTFTLPWGSQEYSVGWDLAAFDGVARVCRDMELVLFAVGLAVITYKVIKW